MYNVNFYALLVQEWNILSNIFIKYSDLFYLGVLLWTNNVCCIFISLLLLFISVCFEAVIDLSAGLLTDCSVFVRVLLRVRVLLTVPVHRDLN